MTMVLPLRDLHLYIYIHVNFVNPLLALLGLVSLYSGKTKACYVSDFNFVALLHK